MRSHYAHEQATPMDIIKAINQPTDVWQCVEREIMASKPFKARDAVRLGGGHWQPEGWLHPGQPLRVFECLLALDVPVTRLFTACSLRDTTKEPTP